MRRIFNKQQKLYNLKSREKFVFTCQFDLNTTEVSIKDLSTFFNSAEDFVNGGISVNSERMFKRLIPKGTSQHEKILSTNQTSKLFGEKIKVIGSLVSEKLIFLLQVFVVIVE